MTKYEKITWPERGATLGLVFCFASLFGSVGHRLYRTIDPLPIERRYNELENDKEVKIYNKLKHVTIKELEESPEFLEEYQSILSDPEVEEYRKIYPEIQDIEHGNDVVAGAFGTGVLLFFSSAIGDYIGKRRKKRKQKLEEENVRRV